MISIKTARMAGGEGMRWGSVLRCRCWDCGALRRSLLRRVLQVAAMVALAGMLGHLVPVEVRAIRQARAPASVERVG